MIGYRDTLYIFGGEVGFSNGIETPLWMYNITVRYKAAFWFNYSFQIVYSHSRIEFPKATREFLNGYQANISVKYRNYSVNNHKVNLIMSWK